MDVPILSSTVQWRQSTINVWYVDVRTVFQEETDYILLLLFLLFSSSFPETVPSSPKQGRVKLQEHSPLIIHDLPNICCVII